MCQHYETAKLSFSCPGFGYSFRWLRHTSIHTNTQIYTFTHIQSTGLNHLLRYRIIAIRFDRFEFAAWNTPIIVIHFSKHLNLITLLYFLNFIVYVLLILFLRLRNYSLTTEPVCEVSFFSSSGRFTGIFVWHRPKFVNVLIIGVGVSYFILIDI